jgi:integrase
MATSQLAPHRRTRTPKYRRQREASGHDRAFVELNGKRIHLGTWNSPESRQLYDRLVAEWLANHRTLPVETPRDGLTVMELVARFWLHAETYYRGPDGRPSGELSNYRDALRPLCHLYGPTPAPNFGPKSLDALRQWMIKKGLARSYINRTVSRMIAVFRWGVAEELVEPFVYQRIKAVRGLRKNRSAARESKPVTPATQEQVDGVRPFVSRQVAALIDLQLLTGARSGELLKLRPIDIQMGDDVWTYTPSQHKTLHHGHKRTIYFGPKALAVLQQFMAGRPVDAYLFSPREAERERRVKSPTHRRNRQKPNKRETNRELGHHYTRESYRRAVARACDIALAAAQYCEYGYPP